MPKMKDKIKQLLTSKKPVLALVLFFIILGIITPFHHANAKIPVWITKALGEIIGDIGIIIFGLVAITFLGNFLLSLSVALLKIVISPGFISLSYTNPVNNDILKYGWSATRDLVNIGFVIVLIIIGLATALRIKEYQWQKTLPKLIGIILLVNFTPVIIGAVVDASNIVMNHFLGKIQEWGAFELVAERDIGIGILKIATAIVKPSVLAQLFTLWMYCYTTAAILLLYSILFILRYVAIWILVILSPLAFFAYILPGTRQYFRMWWRQLINWCFIGVVAGFFLYLANITLNKGIIAKSIKGEIPTSVEGGGYFNTILPYLVVVAFLYIAFFAGFKTSAYGANAVIGWARKREKGVAGWIGRKTREKARVAAQRAIKTERWKKIADRLATLRGPLGVGKLVRPLGRAMKRLPEEEKKIADEAEDKAKKMDAAHVATEVEKGVIPGLRDPGRVAGLLSGAAEDLDKAKDVIEKFKIPIKEVVNAVKWSVGQGQIDRAKKLYRGYMSFLQEKEIRPEDLGLKFDLTKEKDREQAKEFGVKKEEALETLRVVFPGRTGEELERMAEEYDKKYQEYGGYAGKLVADARTVEEIKAVKDILTSTKPEHEKFQRVVQKFWDSTQARRAGEEIGSAFLDRFQEFAHTKEWYELENPKMAKFIESTAGQSVGLAFKTPEETAMERTLARTLRAFGTEDIKTSLRETREALGRLPPGPSPERDRLTASLRVHERELRRRERAEWEAAEAAAEEKPKKGKKEKEPRRKHGRIIR